MDNHAISRIIYPSLNLEHAILDFYQLALFRGNPKLKCRIGADFVNFFTHAERLNTVGREGISFTEFLQNKNGFLEKGYVQRMLDFYDSEPPEREVWILYRIFNLYFGAISIFQPHIAVSLFDRFKPKCVLSPCAGWGGILVGAVSDRLGHFSLESAKRRDTSATFIQGNDRVRRDGDSQSKGEGASGDSEV
jgi:hypothetical protein